MTEENKEKDVVKLKKSEDKNESNELEKKVKENVVEEKAEAKIEKEKIEDKTVEKKLETEKEEIEEKKSVESSKPAFVGDLDFLSEVREDLPKINPGDIIKVSYRVIEGGKERTQIYEGTVIAIKNSGISKTITVRKTSFGIAVERIFPLNSKLVQKIVVKKHSKIRRAKLYYLRKLKGKAARLKELR